MTDRAWLSVYLVLARVFIVSQPYDARGAFMLLHAIDAMFSPNGPGITHTAARLHIVAAFERKECQLAAARLSMIQIAADLEHIRTWRG